MSGPYRSAVPEILTEVAIARERFPDPEGLDSALYEEMVEAAQALHEHLTRGAPRVDLDRELIQVAAMCVRMLEEWRR